METTLTCVQFEKRIQSLMDSRQELTNDSLLDEHRAHCPDCREILDSYQSLEDSFSGKIPPSIQSAIGHTSATVQTNRWSGYMPLLLTLTVGLIAGTMIGFSPRWITGPTADRSQTQNALESSPVLLSPLPADDLAVAFSSLHEVNSQLIAVDQLLQQFPTLNLYYRYTADLPAVRSIQTSFNVAFHWLQEAFFPDLDQADQEKQ